MIEIQKRHVEIICSDGILLKGFINVIQDRKLIDLLKDTNESFILLNDVEIDYKAEAQSFKLVTKEVEQKKSIILNKAVIKWITEV